MKNFKLSNLFNRWRPVPHLREVSYTTYTLRKYENETAEERLKRMNHLLKQFLKIKDQIPHYTVDELDSELKERFNVIVIENPLPLSKHKEDELSSLGEDDYVTEEDIVRIYQFKDAEVNSFLRKQEKKWLFCEFEEFEDVQDFLQEEYENMIAGEDDNVDEYLFPNGLDGLSKKEIFTILYKDFFDYDDGPTTVVLESKDKQHITGYTMINEGSTLISALLFITTTEVPKSKDYDIEDNWFQEYLEALYGEAGLKNSSLIATNWGISKGCREKSK